MDHRNVRQGQSDKKKVERAFTLHWADQGWIPDIPYGTMSLLGVISEHSARCLLWASLSLAPIPKITHKCTHTHTTKQTKQNKTRRMPIRSLSLEAFTVSVRTAHYISLINVLHFYLNFPTFGKFFTILWLF